MDQLFDSYVIGRIMKMLDNTRARASLAALGSTCSKMRDIAQPLIKTYHDECEARFTVLADYMKWCDEDGYTHRYHGPAIIYRNGKCQQWYRHGELHRVDRGPDGAPVPKDITLPAFMRTTHDDAF